MVAGGENNITGACRKALGSVQTDKLAACVSSVRTGITNALKTDQLCTDQMSCSPLVDNLDKTKKLLPQWKNKFAELAQSFFLTPTDDCERLGKTSKRQLAVLQREDASWMQHCREKNREPFFHACLIYFMENPEWGLDSSGGLPLGVISDCAIMAPRFGVTGECLIENAKGKKQKCL